MIELPHKRFHMLLHGHVLDRLRELPDESVDCIMTSPPYFGLRFYRGAESIWGGEPNCEHDFSNAQPADLPHEDSNNRRGTQEEVAANPTGTTYIRKLRGQPHGDTAKVGNTKNDAQPPSLPVGATCLKCGAWRGQLGLEPDFRMYLDHLLMVTAELKRVLKKSGTLWWNMGDTYASSGGPSRHFGYSDPKWPNARNGAFVEPAAFDQGIPSKSLMLMPERLAMRMVDEQQWVLRNMNIWHKPNHMPSSVSDRLSNSYEFVMLFTKAQRYFFDLDAIRVPLSPVTLKEIEKEYNGTSLKDYGGAMAQDASESKRRIVKSLQKYRSGNAERKTEQLRLSHLGSSIPWPAEDSHGGKNPGDVLHYDSKYVKDEYGQPLQGFERDQSIAERRQKSREEAAKLFPGDPQKQQEYINFVHDHNMHPLGKNPGDVFATKHDEAVGRTSGNYKDPLHTKAYHPNGKNPGDVVEFFRQKGSGGNYDYDGINSKDGSHYHELGKNPGDVLNIKRSSDEPVLHEHDINKKGHSGYYDKEGNLLVNPNGKNPGDVMDYAEWYFNEREKKSWHDHKDDMEKGMHHTGHMENIPHPFGKHPDDFWEINPKPHPFAHFAVYPVELCMMPIKAGCPLEICTKCGKAREKIIKSDSNWEFRKQKGATGGAMVEGAKQQIGKGWSHDLYSSAKVTGHTDCGCNAPFRPGIVLDPFAGSGTTGVAARQLGRSSILIEVSDEYCKIAKQRMEWGQQTLDGTEWIEK